MASLESRSFGFRAANALVAVRELPAEDRAADRALPWPYPFPQGGWPWWVVLLSGLVLGKRRRPWPWRLARVATRAPHGGAVVPGTLVPVVGLVQVGMQAWADRYTYCAADRRPSSPPLGVCRPSRPCTERRRRRRSSRFSPLARVWRGCRSASGRTTLTLYRHAVSVVGENHLSLPSTSASSLMAEGRHEDALAQFRRAVELDPDNGLALYNLGLAAAYAGGRRGPWAAVRRRRCRRPKPEGRVENPGTAGGKLLAGREEAKAIASFSQAGGTRPGKSGPPLQPRQLASALGAVRGGLGALRKGPGAAAGKPPWRGTTSALPGGTRAGRRRRCSTIARPWRLSPGLAIARFNLGIFCWKRGDLPEAERQLRETVKSQPSFWQAFQKPG